MFRQLAQGLATRGHEVTVACGYPNHPGGGVFGGYRKRLITRETDGGIQIVRSWHLTTTRRTLPARAAAMTSQTLGAVVAANWTPRPNVVVSVGPPLVGPLAAAACAHRFQVPLVTVIFDIYPDVAINAGKLRNPLLVSFARSLESLAYRLSTKVIVLSDGFRSALITKGVPAAKIDVIPVWLEEDEIRPLPRDTRFRRELGLDAEKWRSTSRLEPGGGKVSRMSPQLCRNACHLV
ncbi:MAG: glycosyltransferase, partial [Chloroflexi bacterium]|nr:glycosyltransferase [Chloroflexota bacterium]